MQSLAEKFQRQLPAVGVSDPQYVPQLVAAILAAAREGQATDVHLVPAAGTLEMHWRIDGVLQPVAQFPGELAPRIVSRLKVLARLLTYQTDTPQEGRLFGETSEPADETRLSTFPTLFGEKAVIRLFVGAGRYRRLDELGLPLEILAALRRLLDETSGVILLTGPAGSGKTTTIYAALRELADKTRGGRSLVTLEDPIEVVVPGVAQSQVQPASGFSMAAGLRSLLRQDPEVIMVGEIRDRETAETVFQAALTGHLVLTTFHAGSAAQAINRLSDMGIEPYLLRSAVRAILCQRLVRQLCSCARVSENETDRCGIPLQDLKSQISDPKSDAPPLSIADSRSSTSPTGVRVPVGCPDCQGTGFRGRFLLTEMLSPERSELGRAILSRSDASRLEQLAVAAGMTSQYHRACRAIAEGRTSPAEVRRALGFSH
ncbi:MAG TPA: GspE/PulE family protein [Planctomycetaceae bacterium]|nr:GspE/PulE family protein [Planctomycetaceae bacterium]